MNDNDTLRIIQIDPIEMRTASGLLAEIWAITPNKPEAFIGTVALPRRSEEVRWTDTGICWEHDEECNLVRNTFEFANVLMLRQLRLT